MIKLTESSISPGTLLKPGNRNTHLISRITRHVWSNDFWSKPHNEQVEWLDTPLHNSDCGSKFLVQDQPDNDCAPCSIALSRKFYVVHCRKIPWAFYALLNRYSPALTIKSSCAHIFCLTWLPALDIQGVYFPWSLLCTPWTYCKLDYAPWEKQVNCSCDLILWNKFQRHKHWGLWDILGICTLFYGGYRFSSLRSSSWVLSWTWKFFWLVLSNISFFSISLFIH